MSQQLKPCPCGAVPTDLDLEEGYVCKYAFASGNCCGEWSIGFLTNYHRLDTPEAMRLAVAAWNDVPRDCREARVAKLVEALDAIANHIDRLPESVLKMIVAETVNRNAAAATGDCGGVLPCPFCGGNADFDAYGNTVICEDCYATGAEHQTSAIAIALWNRRVPVRVVAG